MLLHRGRTVVNRIARILYRNLPLSSAQKWQLKSSVYRSFGLLFRDTAAYQHWRQTQAVFTSGTGTPTSAEADATQLLAPEPGDESSLFLFTQAIQGRRHPNVSSATKQESRTPMTYLRELALGKLKSIDLKTYYTIKARALFHEFLRSGHSLSLPFSNRPKASIILVLYNRAEVTYLCLLSIVETVDLPIEIIIVDNASTDDTQDLLARIEGARIIRNDENVGFVKAVNQVLRESTGEHVLLLNNDTQLFPEALAAAVHTLESHVKIGAVGGRIVLLDGKLQEAGSIIWNDGSCLGYGRNAPPAAGPYLFRRDVDYCSACFLLVRRNLFLELGGFDESLAPAYYEETDLCMRLRNEGYRVVYEPDAVILHFEFASSASEDRPIELQEINRRKFVAKHKEALTRHCAPNPMNELVGRSAERHKARLLLLEDRVPHRALGSGFPRANDIVHCLVDLGWFVTIYPMVLLNEDLAELYSDLPHEVEIIYGRGVNKLESFLKERSNYYDTIMISRPHNMQFFSDIYKRSPGLCGSTEIIYDAEAVFALRELGKRKLMGVEVASKDVCEMINEEVELGRWANKIVTVSAAEAAEFTRRGVREVHVLGHQVVPKPSENEFERRSGILFVGGIHGDDTPNADSVLWFARNVWPALVENLPDEGDFFVAGTNKSAMVSALNGKGRIMVHGFLRDLSVLYERCRLFVVPTRYGAGIPYKAHEAAAYGLPMVTTCLIASQLGWRRDEDLLVADTPEEFGKQCLRLYTDKSTWIRVRENALRRVAMDCSRGAFSSSLAAIVGHSRELEGSMKTL